MKRSILCTFALGVSALVAPIGLTAQDQIRMTIPFDFTVGAKTLPPGEYVILQPGQAPIVSIQRTDGKSNVVFLTNSSRRHAPAGKVSMTFHRYGNRHFLATIAGSNKAWELLPSPQERELLAKQPAQLVNVAASVKR